MTEIKVSEIKEGMLISLILSEWGIVTSVTAKDGKITIRLDNGEPIDLVPEHRVFNILTDKQLASLREFHMINFGDNVVIFETMYREDGAYRYTGRYLVRVNGEGVMYGVSLTEAVECAFNW